MSEIFNHIANTIKGRRSVKPFMMNGEKIPQQQVESLLELANWAPNHGLTQPWHFVVYNTPSNFTQQHAAIYKANTPDSEYVQGAYDNLYAQGNKVSHAVVAIMQRGSLPKIPAFEEEWAAAAAIQNIMIGATALNIASFWSTGGMILKPAMHAYFNLRSEDVILGVIYLGYADEYPEGIRKAPVSDKVEWR